MIGIEVVSPSLPECIELLDESIVFTHSLYVEDEYHGYDFDKISTFFLVREDDIAIGCGAYDWVGEYIIEIKHVFLREAARGLGVGRKLIEYMEAYAISEGAEIVCLETTVKQKAATNLYLSLGYEYTEPYHKKVHDEQVFMLKNLPIT